MCLGNRGCPIGDIVREYPETGVEKFVMQFSVNIFNPDGIAAVFRSNCYRMLKLAVSDPSFSAANEIPYNLLDSRS